MVILMFLYNLLVIPKKYTYICDKKMMFEQSAGLALIWNNQILLAHPTDREQWQFPKGHVEENETKFEAAVRETDEEIGVHFRDLDVDLFKPIKEFEIEYTNRRGDVYKIVTGYFVYLNTPPTIFDFSKSVMGNGKTEMDECRWFTKEEAEAVIFWRMKNILNELESENEALIEMLMGDNLSAFKREQIILNTVNDFVTTESKDFELWLSTKNYSYKEQKIINNEKK